jgi:hypothetical protein
MNITELDSYRLGDAVKFNDKLNPRLWDPDEHLRADVREGLMKIAQDFRESLGITNLELKDITISGSNAAYTYTPHSDIDLHLVVDLPQSDASEVYKELFDAKKYQYNDQHNITIGGYDVELYVQNANQPHISQGIYSVLNNKWISVPKRSKPQIDDISVRSKYETLSQHIEQAVASQDLDKISAMADKIKKMRQAGLEQHGEFGPENLAFKMLRSQGVIERLYAARNSAKDQLLSLDERRKKKKGGRKKSWGYFGGYWYPGTGYAGQDTPAAQADGGGDGGGESIQETVQPTAMETVQDFVKFCAEKLELDTAPQIRFRRDPAWSQRNRTFGRFNQETNQLEISLANRHVMDILRTVAHELTHQRQSETSNMPDEAGSTGSDWENEANAAAGILMRDYADVHPELFDADAVEEGWRERAGAVAAAACIAGSPGCSTTGQVIKTTQDVGRTVQTAKNMTRAGVQDELSQELRNFIRAQGGDPGSQNLSTLYKLKKRLANKPDPANESASGYIPTKKQAKDPRFSMALTVDIKPGQVGKEANKLKLRTNRQGAPQIAQANGLFENLFKEYKQYKADEDYSPDQPPGPEFRPTMPAGTLRVDVSDMYDWYKLGQHVSNLKGLGKHDFGQGPPASIVSFGDEDTEHKFIQDLKRTGLDVTDIDPRDPVKRPGRTIKTDPTYNVNELALKSTLPVTQTMNHPGKQVYNLKTQSGEYQIVLDISNKDDNFDDDPDYDGPTGYILGIYFVGRNSDGNWSQWNTNVGEKEVAKIYSTIAQLAVKIIKAHPEIDEIEIKGADPQRSRIYSRLMQQNIDSLLPGWKLGGEGLVREQPQQAVAEVIKMPPVNMVFSNENLVDWAYNDAEKKQARQLQSLKTDVPTRVYDMGDHLRAFVMDDQGPVLYLALEKYLDGFKTNAVQIHPRGQGKNLAFKVYQAVSDTFQRPLYSDQTHTDASRLGIWKKLIDKFPNRLVGYDQATREDLPLTATDQGPVVRGKEPIYVQKKKKDLAKPVTPQTRSRTRLLKFLPATAKQAVAEGKFDANPATYDLPRRPLNVPELIKRGAIFITDPHGPNGWEPESEGFSLVTLYNVAKGGWPAEAKQHLKPSMYRVAESGLNRQGSGTMLYDGKYNQILWSIKKLGIPDEVAFLDSKKPVNEDAESYPDVLYHGSTQEIKGPLTPRQAHDIGGAAGSNKNAIYATDDPNFAIAYSLAQRGSDTGTLGWNKDPRLIFFGGKIRHGQNVYLHVLPTRDEQGQPLFTKGAADAEWHSVPGVKEITPIKVVSKPVDQYLHLLRKPTPEEQKMFLANKAKDQQAIKEDASEEAWELVGQPVPEIQQFVKQMGLAKDETGVARIVPVIKATPDTQLPAASIPKLKNLANKPGDPAILKAIQKISGSVDAAEQYATLMARRDSGEGRDRGYEVGNLAAAVKSGNYESPVLLKLPTGIYVIGGRTRLYAALALNVPIRVKILTPSSFAKQAVNEDQQLDEVAMSPSALQKWANSDAAKGIRAGFEAELIFRDTTNDDDDDGEIEPDYDYDERARSVSQVIDFFNGGDYGGLGDRQEGRLQDGLDQQYMEWQDERMYDAFRDEQEDLIKKVLVDENDWEEDNEIQKQLELLDLSDDEMNAIIQAGERAPRFTKSSEQQAYIEANPLYQKYLDAQTEAEGLLDELVQDSIRAEDKFYDAALDDFRENFYVDDDSSFFQDVGLSYMSDIAAEYSLDWPYMTGSGGGNNGGSRDWEDIGTSLQDAVDMPVKVSGNYHSTKRKEGQWIVEPDTSLDPDDREDFGLEIVSPPLPLLDALEKLQEVTDWANNPNDGNAYTNQSTGLHMGVSVPYKGGDVDYLKLILFLGDEYVLQSFGREANTYTKSAMQKFRENIRGGRADPAGAMSLMKNNLIEFAYREIQKGVGTGKYTSAHIQDGYIEFRSAGGDWLAEESADPQKLSSTMLRYARAMQIAADPSAERQEFAKKLYKLVAPEGDSQLALFSQYAAGAIDKDQLKKQWAEKTIGAERKTNQRWKLYNRATGEPVPGQEYNGYTEEEARARAKGKISPGSSDRDFDAAYELRNIGEEQQWEIYSVDTGETLEIVKGKNKGEAADAVFDKYAAQKIGFNVRPYQDPATMTPRAKLAKRIAQPKAGQPVLQNYEVVDQRDVNLRVVGKFQAQSDNAAEKYSLWLKTNNLPDDTEDYGYRKTAAKPAEAEPSVAQNFEPGRQNYELYQQDDPNRIIHRMPYATADEVRAWIAQQEQQGMPPGFLRARIPESTDSVS